MSTALDGVPRIVYDPSAEETPRSPRLPGVRTYNDRPEFYAESDAEVTSSVFSEIPQPNGFQHGETTFAGDKDGIIRLLDEFT